MFIKQAKLTSALGVASLILAAGCTDEKYDLSNLDTTAQVEFNDLTIPLNLTPLEFQSLINLEDECVQIIDGEYVLIKSDEFSESVQINEVKAKPTTINGVDNQQIPFIEGHTTEVKRMDFDFTYENNYDMDKYITKIVSGGIDMDMTVEFKLTDSESWRETPVHYELTDAQFELPVGFDAWYETPNGERKTVSGANRTATFTGTRVADSHGIVTFQFHATRINADEIIEAGLGRIDYADGYVMFKGNFNVTGGNLTVLGQNETEVQYANLDVELHLGELTIKTFTGTARYELDEIAEQHVELNDLPKVLRDKETRISLNNPQLYIQLTNPLESYHFMGNAGMKITQERPEGETIYTAQLSKRLRLLAKAGKQNYLICPKPDEVTNPYGEYADPTKLTMNGLGNILMGDGLPEGLSLDFEVPVLEENNVTDFKLGYTYGAVNGKYTFYAPLAFCANSHVVYNATQTGWDFGSDQKMLIEKLDMTAHLKSELPIDFILTAAPIDEDGKAIPGIEFEVEPRVIPHGYDGEVRIFLTGKIANLYGMEYRAELQTGDKDASVLKPEQSLVLTDIRATISGHYLFEDNKDDDDEADDYYNY